MAFDRFDTERASACRGRAVVLRAFVLLAALTIAVSGCALRLAPNYDKDIFDGLSKANELAMTQFAAVTPGTHFADREKGYIAVIGKLDSVRLEAEARPNPKIPAVADKIAKSIAASVDLQSNDLTQAEIDDLAGAPTPELAKEMIAGFQLMRDTDRIGKLSAPVAARFKSEFEIYMFIALNYEKALGG
jgi:hypothetical protein